MEQREQFASCIKDPWTPPIDSAGQYLSIYSIIDDRFSHPYFCVNYTYVGIAVRPQQISFQAVGIIFYGTPTYFKPQ